MTHLRPKPLERLVDANPVISAGHLCFDCPLHGVHPEWGQCRVRVPLSPLPHGWAVTQREDFAAITLVPSIKVTNEGAQCFWHGFVRNGRFEHCGDAR